MTTATRTPVDLADTLAEQLQLVGINDFTREYRFHPKRLWRLDLAWTELMLGVECEGMGPRGQPGRHQLTQHVHANTEKHSALAVLGWRLIRVTGKQIKSGHALMWIEAALANAAGDVFNLPWDDALPSGRKRKARRQLRGSSRVRKR